MIARLDNPFAMGRPSRGTTASRSSGKPAARMPSQAAISPLSNYQSMFDPALDDIPFNAQEKPTGLNFFRRQANTKPSLTPQADRWEPAPLTQMANTPSEPWPDQTQDFNPGMTWGELFSDDENAQAAQIQSSTDSSYTRMPVQPVPVASRSSQPQGLMARLVNTLENMIFEDVPENEDERPIGIAQLPRQTQYLKTGIEAKQPFLAGPVPTVPLPAPNIVIPRVPQATQSKSSRLAAIARSPQIVTSTNPILQPMSFQSNPPPMTYQIF